MSTPQSSPEKTPDSQMPRRPSEIDAFVDHFLSVVCDTSRRYILEFLAVPANVAPDDKNATLPERRSGDIAKAIGLSAATTSEHLRQLAHIGLLTSRREGNTVYYQLRNHTLMHAFQDLLKALDTAYSSHGPSQERNA